MLVYNDVSVTKETFIQDDTVGNDIDYFKTSTYFMEKRSLLAIDACYAFDVDFANSKISKVVEEIYKNSVIRIV